MHLGYSFIIKELNMKQYIVKVSNSKADFFAELCKQLSLDCHEMTDETRKTAIDKKRALDIDGLQKALSAIEDKRNGL